MRVLSLSHRIQHREVDNHTIFNAPTLFDYDAILIDAGGVFETIRAAAASEQQFTTHANVPVVNGEGLDGATGIAEVLRRRRDELSQALDRGAVIAVIAYPQALLTGVTGSAAIDRYAFLPAPRDLAWDATLIRGGEGNAAAVVDHDHPFAPVIDLLRQDLLYRAYFNERAPGFGRSAKVIARSPGGAPVAVQFSVLHGRVVFLPAPRQAGAQWLAPKEGAAVVQAMREMHGRTDEAPPAWLSDVTIPGLAGREAEAERARIRFEEAQAEYESAQAAVDEAAILRDTLWREGDTALLPAVLRCLQLLGFEPKGNSPEETRVAFGGDDLHLVVAGSNEPVDMAPHYRLRQRVDREIERRARPARGLLVVAGERTKRPADRRRHYRDALRVGAEATGYALVTATALFDATIAALAGAPDEDIAEVRRRLMETNGAVDLDDLLNPPAPKAAEEAPSSEAPSSEAPSSDATGPEDEVEDGASEASSGGGDAPETTDEPAPARGRRRRG